MAEDDVQLVARIRDREVTVKPAEDWPAMAIRAVNNGDYDTWAEECLAGDDYAVWTTVKPTLRECNEFFADLKDQRVDAGKSQASRRSSTPTKPR